MAEDISRRIDDLLGGAIDEQVREQRALNEAMVGVRDGISRLVGDVAALSARVTDSRETAQSLREELPFLVQREVGTAVNAMSIRIDVLETAVGELVASLAGLEERVGPDVIIGGVAARMEQLRAMQEEQAGAVTAAQAHASIEAATTSLLESFDKAATSTQELVEKNFTQVSKRLAEVKKWTDDVEGRMRALEKALEANLKMPGDVRKQLNELTGATQDMTDAVVEEIRINAEAGASRLAQSVEGVDGQALEMNRRFAEMSDRITEFQEQVLAYLQVRDLALEERRDQIVTELLTDFFKELPAKEQDKAASRLRSVFARRRDRRDADRYRSGSPPPPRTPPVSAETLARVKNEVQRQDRLAERPWAERSYVEPSTPAAPEPVFEYEESEPLEVSAPSRSPSASPRKSTSRSTPAKKKSAPKKSSPKKIRAAEAPPPEEAPEEPRELFEESYDDVEVDEPAAPPISEVMEAGEIDVVEMQAFATEGLEEPLEEPQTVPMMGREDEELTPRKTVKPKAPTKKSSKGAKPAARESAVPPPAKESPPPAEEAVEQPKPDVADDTLSQALARVQALVDQHRKPGSARKPKR
ncbi:MAG: hypothetical protein ACYDCC_01910 [Actinomycetota bacterium]